MCQPLCKLLGKELSFLASEEKLPTTELLKDTNLTIGLLFVTEEDLKAEHCSKLKDLTDSLVQLHGELKKRSDASFEVVLIPMNQDASCPKDSTTGIKHLFSQKSCPFLLISSDITARIQEYLVRKYEIQDTPSLILINGVTTDIIVHDGKDRVAKDPKGVRFPWVYPPCSDILDIGHLLQNTTFVKTEGEKGKDVKNRSSTTSLINADSIRTPVKGLLFAAFWFPPCKTFLGPLIDVYERVNKEGRKFEIVFVSSDRSQESFERFFSSMPWLAIPFEDKKRRDLLTKAFNIKAIPNLTLLDDNDKIITTEGRLEINDDLEGIEFPWFPRLVDELRDKYSPTLNHCLCVIYFTDDSEADYEVGESILYPIATEITKSSVEEAIEPKFFVAADSDLAESLRIFMDLNEKQSHVVIMDVATFRYAIQKSDTQPINQTTVKEFLNKFQTNKLTYTYMQSRFV